MKNKYLPLRQRTVLRWLKQLISLCTGIKCRVYVPVFYRCVFPSIPYANKCVEWQIDAQTSQTTSKDIALNETETEPEVITGRQRKR